MISPRTPPGTKVRFICMPVATLNSVDPAGLVSLDRVYTISGWRDEGYCHLDEMPTWHGGLIGVHRRVLCRVELPRSITSALTEQPLVIDECEVERA